MKRLTCEMCGSNNLIKQNGVFVCQDCGTQYSVEEAKKMMIEGVVRVDNSHLIDNYFEMANNAYKSSNFVEAETYCNKIIEIEPNNYKAWMLKGKSAGWQTTLLNFRLPEFVSAVSKAILNSPDDERFSIIAESKNELITLSKAILKLRGDHFIKWPDADGTNDFINDISNVLGSITEFCDILAGIDYELSDTETVPADAFFTASEFLIPIGRIITESVEDAWSKTVFPAYSGGPKNRNFKPDSYDWGMFIDRIGFCKSLLETTISVCGEDYEGNIKRYEYLIFLQNNAINSCSWDYEITDWGKRWHKDKYLSFSAKLTRRNWIKSYKTKIQDLQNAI